MKTHAERETLLMRYLDGRQSPAEARELEAWLREDAAARESLRELAGHAVMMGDLARARTLREPAAVPEARVIRPRFSMAPWIGLAAALVALAVLSTLMFSGRGVRSRNIIEVEEVVGALAWTGPTGEQRSGIAKGQRLPAGTFESDDESTNAVLVFLDGTRLTLGGGIQVFVGDDGQKRVNLKSGTLGADVRPQPTNRPLLIRTPTATLEVLGTVFSVTAAPEQTTMNVEEGRVRLQRLADGETVDVTANHAVVASLEASSPLVTQRNTMPPVAWRADFSQPPGGGSRGEWISASAESPAHWNAVPLIVGRKVDGQQLIQHGVGIRDNSLPNSGSFVTAESRSVVRLRCRMEKPGSLLFFCITQRPGGGFGGNFELTLPPDAGTPDADGWRRLEVPLTDFSPLQPHRATHPAGNGISHFSVKTHTRDSVLEVAELAIEPGR